MSLQSWDEIQRARRVPRPYTPDHVNHLPPGYDPLAEGGGSSPAQGVRDGARRVSRTQEALRQLRIWAMVYTSLRAVRMAMAVVGVIVAIYLGIKA